MSEHEQTRKLREELEAHDRDGLTTITLGVPLVRAMLDREERLRHALQDAEQWLVVPSDIYPHQYERLAEVRADIRTALSSPAEPDKEQG